VGKAGKHTMILPETMKEQKRFSTITDLSIE
jgi:hypothetical protein